MGAVETMMRPAQEGAQALPLTMAAVTVAGQCRERSPSDLALFGEAGARFSARFVDPAEGDALLAIALAEGAAEGRAELRTGSGRGDFRVSLWRQRGGQRIRVMASFAAVGASRGGDGPLLHDAPLRRPLLAVIGVAERLRDNAGCSAPVGDLLAASWHMLRVIDEGTTSGSRRPRLAEVDLARLCGRLARLAEPGIAATEVILTVSLEACAGQSVMADEGALWGVVETMLHAAIERAEPGSEIGLRAAALPTGGLELAVSLDRVGPDAGQAVDLGDAALFAEENGLRLGADPDGGFPLRLTVPRGRLLAI